MVQDELYGTDTESLNTPEGEKMVDSALANIKYNVYKKRKEFLREHSDDNVLNRSEEYEHYLNLDSSSASAISSMTNQAQIIEKLKDDNAKLQVELYKYTSNPILKDTDFDGLDDNDDPTPKNGTLYYYTELINNNGYINLNDTMDYRYFYMSNKYYYDEIARISLIMSNAVTKGVSGTGNFGTTYIDEAMKSIGMGCSYEDVVKDNLKAGLAIGHKEVEYADIKKNVILVAVSNARTIDEYEKFSDIGKSNWSNDSNYNVNYYKAYEILANEIYNKIKIYLTTNNINQNVVYWITGYGTGGGIANVLSAKIADKPFISTAILDNNTIFDANNYKWKETGMSNLYAYTFGTPYTVYTGDIGIQANANKYKSIFNVVETNDSFAHLPSTKSSWTRYGWNMSIDNNSHKECQEVVNAYNGIVCTTEGFWRDNLYEIQTDDSGYTDKNKAIDIIKLLMKARGEKELSNINATYESLKQKSDKRYNILFDRYSKYYEVLEKSHSIKNYYDLCKKLLPEHMKTGDGWESKIDEYGNEMKEALDTMGKWYVENVYTYQVGSYGAKRYKIIEIRGEKNNANPIGYIFKNTGDIITADDIRKIYDEQKNPNGEINYSKVTYEQNIPLDKAEKELRKGTVQKDDDHVSYYDGERYQAEFKHRFEYYLDTCGEEARDNREGILTENRIDPEEIYSFDKREDGAYWYDVDNYMNGEMVKREKGIARGTYKYNYNDKTILNVADDCSGFAEAVLIKFVKDMQMEGSDKLKNLWYGSSSFANGTALNKLEKYGFKCYKANTKAENNNGKEDELKKLYDKGLQYGDLVCSNGHIEFYRDDTHSFGWGRTHSDYENNDEYNYNWVWSDTENCLYDSKLEKADGTVSLSSSDK